MMQEYNPFIDSTLDSANENDGKPFDLPSFEQRLQEQHTYETRAKQETSPNFWTYSRGDYSRNEGRASAHTIVGDTYTLSENEIDNSIAFSFQRKRDQLDKESLDKIIAENVPKVETLQGIEHTYAQIIRELLHDPLAQKPFVVLDIGGMFSLSMLRLAHFFQTEIKNGNIIFLSTSLEQRDFSHFDKAGFTPAEEKFIQENNHLIHRQQSSVAELLKLQIDDMPILGNVGLLVDNNAVSLHSKVPSLHQPILGALLSEKGTLISNTVDLDRTSITKDLNERKAYEAELKRSRLLTAEKFGLQLVEKVEAGDTEFIGKKLTHFVMKAPLAPKISVFSHSR